MFYWEINDVREQFVWFLSTILLVFYSSLVLFRFTNSRGKKQFYPNLHEQHGDGFMFSESRISGPNPASQKQSQKLRYALKQAGEMNQKNTASFSIVDHGLHQKNTLTCLSCFAFVHLHSVHYIFCWFCIPSLWNAVSNFLRAENPLGLMSYRDETWSAHAQHVHFFFFFMNWTRSVFEDI